MNSKIWIILGLIFVIILTLIIGMSTTYYEFECGTERIMFATRDNLNASDIRSDCKLVNKTTMPLSKAKKIIYGELNER